MWAYETVTGVSKQLYELCNNSCANHHFRQVQYLLDPEVLHVTWVGFEDQESGIADFFLQIFQGDACNDGDVGDDHFVPISELVDVKNETDVSFYEMSFEMGKYRF